MRGRATRVAVVQLDCHPAAVLPDSTEPLEDPLFGGKDETIPTPGAVADVLAEPLRALRTRVRATYCAQLLRKVTAILEACRGWRVQVVVFPEYSVPWQILDGVAAASGDMVTVAGTHAVTRAARTDGVYRRLGGIAPPSLEAVAPVLHRGKLLALTSKMHAAKPERGALRESERWSTIELPPDLGLPSPLGVVICLDFLVAPGAEPDKVTRDKLQQARLLAVPSWTPTHTLREFEAAAWVSAARGRTPVLYANVTEHGGSTIYVDKDHGDEAARFPQQIGRLDAGDEGVVVVDVDLSDQRRGTLTQYLDREIVTPIAQASLVYRSHPAGAAYASWLEAQALVLAKGDDGLDDVIAAIKADAAILRSAGGLPGAAARRLRLRSLLNYPEGLNRIEDVECRLREVVLPADVVRHGYVRVAMARGAGQAIDDLLLHGELRGEQRELVAIRDRLQAGGKVASQRTEAEWTEAGRDALAAITAAVRGDVPVAPAPAVRIEMRPLPTEIEPVALADRAVTIHGRARELVFRARASEVVAALYRPLHRDGEVDDERDDELQRARSGSSDVLAVDRLVSLLRAEGGTHLAVVGLGPDEVERAALSDPNAQSALADLTAQVPAGKPYEIAPLVPLAVVARLDGGCRLYRIAVGDARKELGILPWQPREAAGLEAALAALGLGKSSWIDVSAEEIATRIAGLRPVLDGARDVIIGLRDRRLREVGGHYVDPDVAVDDRSGPARGALDVWLDPEPSPHDKADRPIALVLGEFGAGKSTLLADWCLHRWRDRSDGPRPILIDLAGVGEQADALALVLGGCGLADTPAHRAAMALLIAAGHAVPCFDSFDEMATRLQASALAGRLAALTSVVAGGGHAVVSSRSNYFPNASAEQELDRALASSLAQSAPHTRMEVQGFDEAKVQRLVTDVVGPERAPELLRRIQATYDLRDLAKRPLLLGMVIQTLEQLPPGKRVTQAVLYERYLARWLANTHSREPEAFTDSQKCAFAETLAEALWRTGATSLGWEALRDTVRARLFRELPEDVPPGAALLEIAGGAFFVREGDDRYRFAHKSFFEYFFARALLRGLVDGSTRGLDTRPLSAEVIAFVFEVLLLEASDAPERHPAVVVAQSWLTTERAREGELGTTASTAANAVRLLHGLAREARTTRWIPDGADLRAVNLDGEDLSGIELRQARLDGASLRAARLVSAVLEGAWLARAVLDEAVLDGATLAGAHAPSASFVRASARESDLRGADLRGANLAQSQWLDCRWADARWADARAESAIFVGPRSPASAATELLARVGAGHEGPVSSVAWHGDGTRLASGGADGTVRVWDATTQAELARLEGHEGPVSSVAWHEDGTRLASGGADKTVRVWDATTYEELARLDGHGGPVRSVAWQGDGTRLASGGADGTVRVWDVGNADVPASCRVVITAGDHGSLVTLPSGYVRIDAAADRLLLQLEASSPRVPGVTRFLPMGALRPFFERPDLVTRSLAGETVPTTPLDDLHAAGWNPGPMWDGSPTVLTESPEHARLAIDAPAATPRTDALTFVPGPAITDGRDLDGRAEIIDELLRLTAARTPAALLGPRRAGKTSLLHTLAARLRHTHEVHHATLEGAQLATRDHLARRLVPALAAHPAPAEALLQVRSEMPAVYLIDELAWLARLPADHLAWLRALGQHAAMLVLAGSHQDWRTVAAHARTAPGSSFANDVWVVEVGPMARRDATQFLVTGGIANRVAEMIVEACGGWPFYLQVMGFAVLQELRVGRAVEVRDQVIELRHRRLIVDRDPVFAGRWAELPHLARATLLAHLDQLPRLDDLTLDAADAVLGAGLATPAGTWLDDIPWFQWVRFHARRLTRAEGM